MRWISDQGEYARQREALRRRTNWESWPGGEPNPSWESEDNLDPNQSGEPDPLPRPQDLLRKPRPSKRHHPR